MRRNIAYGIFLRAYEKGGLDHAIDAICAYASKTPKSKPVRYEKTICAIASWHGISPRELVHGGRHKRYLTARRQVAESLRRQGWSYPEIGRALKQSHATIINLLKNRAAPNRAAPTEGDVHVV